MTNTDGPSVRIDGPVQLQPGFSYTGYGSVCRVEILPALNFEVTRKHSDLLRYVTYRPGRWYMLFPQWGTYYWIEESVETAHISNYVDMAAFQWRKRRTTTYWARSPMDVFDAAPDEPYSFEPNIAKNPAMGFVYFAEALSVGRVRIGWTASPDRRPNEIVRHSPSPLKLLALLPGEKADESHLQYVLSHWRSHGDWFELTDEIRAYIQMLKRRWRDPSNYPSRQIEVHEPIGTEGVPTESK